MRILKHLVGTAAIASLAVAPVVAQASGASALSLRAATKAKHSNGVSPSAQLLISLAVVGVIVGIAELSKSP